MTSRPRWAALAAAVAALVADQVRNERVGVLWSGAVYSELGMRVSNCRGVVMALWFERKLARRSVAESPQGSWRLHG